jgi:hypothetical protein
MDNLSIEDISCKELLRMDFMDDLVMIQTFMELYVTKNEGLESGIVF